jgi:hypothetical protein
VTAPIEASGARLPYPEQEHAQVGQHADDAHHAQEPREAEERRVLADARDEGGADDHEVEDVPARAEEHPRARPVRREARQELDDEHGEADGVHEVEQPAPPVLDSS